MTNTGTSPRRNEWTKAAGATAELRKEAGPLQFLVDIVPGNIVESLTEMRMLQVIFFAILFGIMLLLVDPKHATPLNTFMNACNEVFIKMVDVIMLAAPWFVFALMTLAGGTDLDSDIPADRYFMLGGPGSFPGFELGELRLTDYWTASGSYLWKFKDLMSIRGQALYAGVRLEAGQVSGPRAP